MTIQADLHTHTVASTHAYSTITENCAQAQRIGVKCVALTDHGTAVPDSPHIWHFGNMRVLPRKICGVTVLKGVEANIINYDGELDIPQNRLDQVEWVAASYHRYYFDGFSPADPKTVTEGYLKLFDRYLVDIVGHPTTQNFPVDWERLVKAAKERDILLELNESSFVTKKSPKENILAMLEACKKYGCEIAVDSDAHFWTQIAEVKNVMRFIEETGFPQSLIANLEWERLREKILKKRPTLDI